MSTGMRLAVLTLGVTLAATPCAAQRRVVVGPRGNARVVHPRVHHVFRTGDRGIFHNYFLTHRIVVTPLRSEIARLVIRGKPLPTGVVRVALAAELLALVPPPAPGYEYVIVGDRIVMLDDEGNVEDIIEGVFP